MSESSFSIGWHQQLKVFYWLTSAIEGILLVDISNWRYFISWLQQLKVFYWLVPAVEGLSLVDISIWTWRPFIGWHQQLMTFYWATVTRQWYVITVCAVIVIVINIWQPIAYQSILKQSNYAYNTFQYFTEGKRRTYDQFGKQGLFKGDNSQNQNTSHSKYYTHTSTNFDSNFHHKFNFHDPRDIFSQVFGDSDPFAHFFTCK